MHVLLIDTETTGLDPERHAVIEVAAILFDVTSATAIESFASLIHAESNEAEAVNRIPVAALRDAPTESEVWPRVHEMASRADAFLAHNAEFDRAFFPEHLAELRPWVCTKEDVEWPKSTRQNPSLVPLALEHDLGVAVAHRALADADLIARLLTRCHELGHDLQTMLARAMRPKVLIRGLQRFDDNQLAKDAGFRWDGERKWWLRRMFLDDAAALTFPWRIVEEDAA